MSSYFIVGGAGFLGSHFCDHLLSDEAVTRVTVFDNFTSGRRWHVERHVGSACFRVVEGDAKDIDALTVAMAGHETVIHLASNPDIARAAKEPDIDFREGTVLTNNVIEAMRRARVGQIIYASGSGVYGDTGHIVAAEDYTPMRPISTYGASKLAGEAMISAYAYMFGMRGLCFRFGNIVGARQTHGVGYDFVRRLRADNTRLTILGDGRQTKSYIHVADVIAAVMFARERCRDDFATFNVATGDAVTVKEIADLACELVGLDPARVDYQFAGGDRGWKGDVPVVLLDISRIRALGWPGARPTREALRTSLQALNAELEQGLI